MKPTLECIVLDCPDPVRLAEFYRSIIGGTVNRPDRRWEVGVDAATLHPESGPVLLFHRVEDYRPPRWGDPDHPQQFHLDFAVSDVSEAHAKALANGATYLDDQRGWRVYADPAGHPFCLIRDWWSATGGTEPAG